MNFNLPAFLDIAIGLVFIYLILSLLASEIQELFAGFFQWRAKHLKMSIYRMLIGTGNVKELEQILKYKTEENIEDKINAEIEGVNNESKKELLNANKSIILLIHEIYSHYEIASLSQSSLGFAVTQTKDLYGPSYIPPESFAEAFIDILAEKKKKFDENNPENKDLDLIATVIGNKLNSLPDNLKAILARIAEKAVLKVDMLDPKPQGSQYTSSVMVQFQVEIANWFSNSQDRTSGTYKRNSKLGLFLIGLLAAIFANANTFTILENLHDEDVREAVVTQAISTANDCQDKKGEDLATCIDDKVDAALESNKLPIGWFESIDQESPNNVLKIVFYDLLGFIVTGLAIMMGAPFWFDLLKKFVNVRNAGPKPQSENSSSTNT
ncbi:hypothetical protein Xen7305DRAFT_00003390 [Xenococcus sp. PCC 7305]|uniref:hypothetical protein n=1 Tax=Xenococcus sp. PCC 7305 TaxID=102125 RepID=UPI0002AC21CA|nr:hypothetical protein [Xenococcus sp. PCC 7305]ELS00638.1 hypothetical protein Xen7305DRAFT_00003390 [Xenococcus sp. PCC 7305]